MEVASEVAIKEARMVRILPRENGGEKPPPSRKEKSSLGVIVVTILSAMSVLLVVMISAAQIYYEQTTSAIDRKPTSLMKKVSNLYFPGLVKENPDVSTHNIDNVQKNLGGKILFIGDSITEGLTNCNYVTLECSAVDVNALATEMSVLGKPWTAVDIGFTGFTSWQYLSHMSDEYLSYLRSEQIRVVQIMLGTNDSIQSDPSVSAMTYVANMRQIVNKLRFAGVKVIILNKPIWNKAGGAQIEQYWTALQALVDNRTVFAGDTAGYDWFKENPKHLDDSGHGLHPDDKGYEVLGNCWADAVKRVLKLV